MNKSYMRYPTVTIIYISLLTTALTIVFFKFSSLPYFYIFFLWASFFIYLFLFSSHQTLKAVYFTLTFILVILAAGEYLFSSRPIPMIRTDWRVKEQLESISGKPFIKRDPLLGYSMTPNNIVTYKEQYPTGESLEVVYTINANGLRVAGPQEMGKCKESIVFYGDSFTFGEGVNDKETLPYQVEQMLNERYCVYNFGTNGYGAHQMLAALEGGIVNNIVTPPPQYIFYQGIVGHVNRIVRGVGIPYYGPKYSLIDGELVYSGQFKDPGRLERIINKSTIAHRLLHGTTLLSPNLNLYIKIIENTRDGFKKLYPASEFHVIFWDIGYIYLFDPKGRANERIIRKLESLGIIVHRISDIIPDLEPIDAHYILKFNTHPNGKAYRKIAEAIVKMLDVHQ